MAPKPLEQVRFHSYNVTIVLKQRETAYLNASECRFAGDGVRQESKRAAHAPQKLRSVKHADAFESGQLMTLNSQTSQKQGKFLQGIRNKRQVVVRVARAFFAHLKQLLPV